MTAIIPYPKSITGFCRALNKVIQETRNALDSYRFDHAAQAIYDFTWNEFCDWYIELAKVSLQSEDEAIQRGARHTLLTVLETVLRLTHPIMPFITEEIWQTVAPLTGNQGETIMQQAYPMADNNLDNPQAETELAWVMDFILGVRRIRGEMKIKDSQRIPLLLQDSSDQDQRYLQGNQSYLKKLAGLESIGYLQNAEVAPESAMSLVGNLKLLIPMAGLIDKVSELARLDKEIQKEQNEISRIEEKLNNPDFVNKAPTEVIEKVRATLAEKRTALTNLRTQREKISAL